MMVIWWIAFPSRRVVEIPDGMTDMLLPSVSDIVVMEVEKHFKGQVLIRREESKKQS